MAPEPKTMVAERGQPRPGTVAVREEPPSSAILREPHCQPLTPSRAAPPPLLRLSHRSLKPQHRRHPHLQATLDERRVARRLSSLILRGCQEQRLHAARDIHGTPRLPPQRREQQNPFVFPAAAAILAAASTEQERPPTARGTAGGAATAIFLPGAGWGLAGGVCGAALGLREKGKSGEKPGRGAPWVGASAGVSLPVRLRC